MSEQMATIELVAQNAMWVTVFVYILGYFVAWAEKGMQAMTYYIAGSAIGALTVMCLWILNIAGAK